MQTLSMPLNEIHQQLKKLEEIQNFLQQITGTRVLTEKKEPEIQPASSIKIHCYWEKSNQEVS